MREAAGIDWLAEKTPVQVVVGKVVPDQFAVVRQDTGDPLGIVGRSYTVFQNEELDWLGDAIVDDGSAKYETGGALRGGRTVFLSMELNGLDIHVGGDAVGEAIKTYLLLTNTHDGSRSLSGLITPIRVVCANTLNMAIRGASAEFRIRHVGTLEGKIAAAREALGISFRYVESLAGEAERLLMQKVVDDQVFDILTKVVWPVDPDWSDARIEGSTARKAYELYLTSPNLDNIRDTGWGVVNAVAEYVDHEAAFVGRGASSAADVRAQSILFGRAKRQKEATLAALAAL
jgi:phage/plasmid-like protein (TIGR03299 family)